MIRVQAFSLLCPPCLQDRLWSLPKLAVSGMLSNFVYQNKQKLEAKIWSKKFAFSIKISLIYSPWAPFFLFLFSFSVLLWASVASKKSPNVFKSCPKIISLEKLTFLKPLQKLYKNVSNLGKVIVATGFEKLPKVHYIAKSGHTESVIHSAIPST